MQCSAMHEGGGGGEVDEHVCESKHQPLAT